MRAPHAPCALLMLHAYTHAKRPRLSACAELEDELEEDAGRREAAEREERGRRGREDDDFFVDEDDEMGDFIVEEGADAGRARRRRRAAASMLGVNSRALEVRGHKSGNTFGCGF